MSTSPSVIIRQIHQENLPKQSQATVVVETQRTVIRDRTAAGQDFWVTSDKDLDRMATELERLVFA